MGNLFGTGQGKTVSTQAVRANGMQVQASSYGQGLPIVYGRMRIPGTLIWYGDFQSVEHDQQVGKGGSGGQNVSYTYSSSFQLALCESDGTLTLGQIWQDSSLVSLSDINGTFGAGGGSQAAWSHLSSPDNLQYPFTAWIGCVNLKLGSSPNVPNYNFEINGLLQYAPTGSPAIYDAEPSAIVNDLMTSTTHGIGFKYLGDLTTFKDYCVASGIFLSLVVDQETALTDVLTNLLQITNSNTAWSNGKLIIIPYGDESVTGNGVTYTPPTTVRASFTDADYVKPVKIERKPLADRYNVIRVEWIDPTNNYVTSVAEAKDESDISSSIVRQSQTIQAHSITNAQLAQQTAQRILQRALYIRNVYTFTTTLQYVALEPGDIVELSDSLAELVNEPVRITKIAEQGNNELEITCEEFPAGVSEGATQSVEAAAGYKPNFNGAPDTTQPPVIFRAPQFLVDGDVEVWIGACGSGANWGGANVLVSYDNVTYTKIGSIKPGCRYGTLTAALADSTADPDTVNSFKVALEGPGSLSGGTNAEADNLATLTLVDQELIAYSSTVLNGDGTYTLGNGYMRRQCYQTAHASHAIGAPWMRVDDNIFRWKVDPSLVGTTVYIKLQAWNLYGGGLQSESSLTATTYVVGTAEEIPDTPPVPSNFVPSGAANGTLLTWENTNPAAVAITSIEVSTNGTSGWSVLGQTQGTHYVHAFTGPATYYYRVRARSASFIWSAYTVSASATGGSLQSTADGTSRFAVTNAANMAGVSSVDGNNRALIDFSQSGHVGKTLTNIPDGTGRFAIINGAGFKGVASVDAANLALIDFSQAHTNKNLNYVPDGSTYGSIKVAYKDASGRISGYLGGVDPRGSLPPIVSDPGFSYTSTDSAITISWSAITVHRPDGTTATVAASSYTVTGLGASTTYRFYPYINESTLAVAFATGGNGQGTPAAAYPSVDINAAAVVSSYANVTLQSFTANTAATGLTSGGGGDNTGYCLTEDMWLDANTQAKDAEVGQWLEVAPDDHRADLPERHQIRAISRSTELCLRLVTESGAAVCASEETPVTLRDGSSVKFAEMLGREARVLRGGKMKWEHVVAVEPLGERPVVRLSLGGRSFFAGESAAAMVATHNYNKP